MGDTYYTGYFTARDPFIMASSAVAADNSSRSPSPLTPEGTEFIDPIAIQSDLDLNSWYQSMDPNKPQASWLIEPTLYSPSKKLEDDQMLRLDDIIEQHAYDEYVLSFSI